MKQLIQSYRTGELTLAEVPAPACLPGSLLVRNVRSLVSVGTEKYMLDLAKKSLLGKAMARPDLVRQVVNKVRTEGLAEAYRQATGRLDNPVPLGYSSAGIVIEVGRGVEGFAVGDRVACSGSGHASHAEIVRIPQTMVARIPDGVAFDEAAFVTIGAIATHGVRLAEPALGERVVVLGLGLLGLLAVQILKAAGCRVLGADIAEGKVQAALELGADRGIVTGQDDALAAVRELSGGVGADAVLIFAATESNEPIELAATLVRERGRIVVPGLVGLDIPRKPFYEKEISFIVSRAWGPGLYDPNYEEKGIDYPISFVRWTAQRNMEQFLELVADGKVRVAPLVTHRFPLDGAVDAYERILGGKERFIGVLLEHPGDPSASRTVRREPVADSARPAASPRTGRDGAVQAAGGLRVGLVGAGAFARGTLLPALKGIGGLTFSGVATSSGIQAHHIARRHGFAFATTSATEIMASPEIDLVMILTRHGSHARLVAEALEAGKHVFVEKPLALDEEQLSLVIEARARGAGGLMVGFNRRFAPTTQAALRRLARIQEPLVVTMRVNAGFVPPGSWVHDPVDGGGRIVGEVCHFVDLAQALTRSLPVAVYAESLRGAAGGLVESDNVQITLRMANGSVAGITYAAGGDKGFPRERIEIMGGGAVCVIDDFKTMTWSREGRRASMGRWWTAVDRGHRAEMRALAGALRERRALPVSFEEYVATTRATFAALESLRSHRPVDVPALSLPRAGAGS